MSHHCPRVDLANFMQANQGHRTREGADDGGTDGDLAAANAPAAELRLLDQHDADDADQHGGPDIERRPFPEQRQGKNRHPEREHVGQREHLRDWIVRHRVKAAHEADAAGDAPHPQLAGTEKDEFCPTANCQPSRENHGEACAGDGDPLPVALFFEAGSEEAHDRKRPCPEEHPQVGKSGRSEHGGWAGHRRGKELSYAKNPAE